MQILALTRVELPLEAKPEQTYWHTGKENSKKVYQKFLMFCPCSSQLSKWSWEILVFVYPQKRTSCFFLMYAITVLYMGTSMERTEAPKATIKFSAHNWETRLQVCIFSIRRTDSLSDFSYKIFTAVMYIFWGMEIEDTFYGEALKH